MLDRIKNAIDPPLEAKLHFLHIPKCAGTSMKYALAPLYKPWRQGNAASIIDFNEKAVRDAERISDLPDPVSLAGGVRSVHR